MTQPNLTDTEANTIGGNTESTVLSLDHIRDHYLSRLYLSLEALRVVGKDELLSITPFNQALFELLYAGVVTGIEEYLQDRLTKEVFSSEECIELYVAVHNKLKRNKLKASDREMIQDTLCNKEVYHRLDTLREYFSHISKLNIFDVEIGKDIREIIKTRHKIIHHGSKDENGNRINIDLKRVIEAYNLAAKYIIELEQLFLQNGKEMLIEQPE